MARVSVIFPVYNVRDYIKKSIESLLEQTYKSFEVLIIDDGSEDDSIDIAKDLVGSDSRFKFHSFDNGGVAVARNRGISLSSGEFITFLDSDDYYHPRYLGAMIDSVDLHRSDISVCGVTLVDQNYRAFRNVPVSYVCSISGWDAFLDCYTSRSISSLSQNKLFRRSLFVGVEYPPGVYFEDTATIYKLFYNASSVSFVDEFLFFYLQRSGSTMNAISSVKIVDKFKVLEMLYGFLVSKKLQEDLYQSYVNSYLINGVLSTATQIASHSSCYSSDIKYLFDLVDGRIFSFKNIVFSSGLVVRKRFALLVLKMSPCLFRVFARRYKLHA